MSWPSMVMRPGGEFIECGQQVYQGRFSCARRPDQSDHLTGQCVQGNPAQDHSVRSVTETYLLENDLTLHGCPQLLLPLWIGGFSRGIENVKDALPRCSG